MSTFSEIYFNGSEYTQMWLNGGKIWEKDNGGSGDVPLPSDDQYKGYDLVLQYQGKNDSYGDFEYRVTFPNKLDVSLEYIDSFTFEANSGRTFSGTAKLKNVKFYGLQQTKISGTGRLDFGGVDYTPLKVSAPSSATDLSYLCYQISDETDLRFLRTKNATNMSYMFFQATVTSLDLSAFRTSSVTDMSYMFSTCSSLTSLDLSSFDTSKVTDMSAMFSYCHSLTSLDLSSFDTSKVTNTNDMFNGVSDCTIYIDSDKWTLGTDSTFGGGTNLNFVLVNPITSITLESTLTDTTIPKGTIFTINPIITPIDYGGDEVVVTYNTDYLSMVDNTFTVLDNVPIGESLSITYASSSNPSISATYTITIRDYINIASITLEHTLETLVIEPNTTFTITPIATPALHEDELLVEFDDTYITHNDGVFTITNAPFNESMSITYYSKANPSVNATLNLMVRDFIPITSITLEHTLETLVDVMVGTTFSIVPNVMPTLHDDELLVDYDTNYLSMENNTFTVLDGASEQRVQIIYYSKYNNSVYGMIEFTVAKREIVYPYDDADSVITYRNLSSSYAKSDSFKIIDNSLPYSVNGTNTNSLSVPKSTSSKLKLINLHPSINASDGSLLTTAFFMTSIEQLRIPKATSLKYLFYYFCYSSSYTYSWQPQYFEFGDSITDMTAMFSNCQYLTDDMMNQFMPYFPNTSKVTNMGSMFFSCPSLTSLDLSSFDTRKVTNMTAMFRNCSSLKTLDLSSWDTSSVSSYNYMFGGVTDCTIYIDSDKWTLGTDSTFGGGTNLTFVPKVIPITSIDNLITDLEDITNVTSPTFTITPIITPANYCSDLEVIYDSTYLSGDNFSFLLKDGSQGQTLSITYRSRADNSISNTLTFTVSEDVELIETLIDFTQSTAPTLPTWFAEETKGTYYFTHGTYKYDSTLYGLVEDSYSSTATRTYWNCYKVVAPMTGTLEITFRVYTYSSSYPFTIHATTNATQPSYSSVTNRLISATSTTYRTTDGVATLRMTQGETYYIHFQHRRANSSSTYGTCIRKIEIIPTE